MAIAQWFAQPGSQWQVANWGVVSSGLADPGRYDWVSNAPRLIAQYAPQALLIAVGTNDTRALRLADGRQAEFGEDAWTREYASRVCAIAREGRLAGAQVIIASPPAIGDPMKESQLNLIRRIDAYCAQATGARFVVLPAALSSPAQINAPALRARDGIHMTMDGYRMGAQALLRSTLR
jgi:hypothetical protein